MVRIELTNDEAGVLAHALESYLSDLRMEISHTDRQEFRDGLKGEKAVIEKVIESLRVDAAACCA